MRGEKTQVAQDVEKDRRLEILQTTSSVEEFRANARVLLLTDPTLIGQVVSIFRDRQMAGKVGGLAVMVKLRELQKELTDAPEAERAAHVTKAFASR